MKLTVQEALRKVLDDMKQLPPEQLRAELDQHANGPFALALGDASEFLASFEPAIK